jgi:hypothetical protein
MLESLSQNLTITKVILPLSRFVVSYYPADDTMSLFEPPLRNSGMPGGIFAKRQKMRRPGADGLDYYKPQDLQVRKLEEEDTGITGGGGLI